MSRRKVLLPRPLSPTHRMLNDSTCSKARASSSCCSSEGGRASARACAMPLRSDSGGGLDSGGASEGAADEPGQDRTSEDCTLDCDVGHPSASTAVKEESI
jgi:hypothetical protein